MKLKIAWGALEVWTLSGHWIGLALSSSSSSSSSSWLSWLDSGRWGVCIQTTATSLPTSCNSMKSKRYKTWWRHSDVCDLPLTSAVRPCVPPNLQQAKANILIDNWAKYFYQRTPGRSVQRERESMQCVEGWWVTAWQGLGQWAITCPTETTHHHLTAADYYPHYPHYCTSRPYQPTAHHLYCVTPAVLHHPAIHYIGYNKHMHTLSRLLHRRALQGIVMQATHVWNECSVGKCRRADITARIAFFHCHCKTMRGPHGGAHLQNMLCQRKHESICYCITPPNSNDKQSFGVFSWVTRSSNS